MIGPPNEPPNWCWLSSDFGSVEITLPGGKIAIEWRERDDHVLMTGTADFEYEGRFDPALFASVA